MYDDYKYQATRNAMQTVHEFQQMRTTLREEYAAAAKQYNEKELARRCEGYANEYNESLQKVLAALKALEADIATRKTSRINKALALGTAEEDFKLLSLPVTLSADDLRVLLSRNAENVLFCRAVAEYAKNKEYNDAKDLLAAGENIHAKSHAGEELCAWLRNVTETPGSGLATASTIKNHLEGKNCRRNTSVQSKLFHDLHDNGTFAGLEADT